MALGTTQTVKVLVLVCSTISGKSTLIKVLTGVYVPEEGEIYVDGERVSFSDPVQARIAVAAFCQITGARMGAENLELAQFPEEPDDGPTDPVERFIDSHLYWPDPDRIRDWLAPRATRMASGERLLLGLAAWTHPAPPDLPNDAAHRSQLDLRAWALEIACRSPEMPLPNHRAPVRLAPRGFARP